MGANVGKGAMVGGGVMVGGTVGVGVRRTLTVGTGVGDGGGGVSVGGSAETVGTGVSACWGTAVGVGVGSGFLMGESVEVGALAGVERGCVGRMIGAGPEPLTVTVADTETSTVASTSAAGVASRGKVASGSTAHPHMAKAPANSSGSRRIIRIVNKRLLDYALSQGFRALSLQQGDDLGGVVVGHLFYIVGGAAGKGAGEDDDAGAGHTQRGGA